LFESKVLRRAFGNKRSEIRGGWRKLNNEEVHNLYFSPDIVRMVKSRKVRWAGLVAPMGGEVDCKQNFGGKDRGKEITRKTQS
jgi:hypothetical protein